MTQERSAVDDPPRPLGALIHELPSPILATPRSSRPPRTFTKTAMPRFKHHEPILAAAQLWRERCLLGERSLFTDRSLWTSANFQELLPLFAENLDDLYERLLVLDSPDAKCLWAEITWLYHLIEHSGSMGPESKRRRIAEVWMASGRDFPEDQYLLADDVLGGGVLNPGRAYSSHAWREYHFFVVAMLDWFSLHVDEREFLLGDPWEFASWLDATQLARNRMLRHAIVFLFFPDEFEPIISNRGKREIVSQLHQGNRVDPSDAVAVDRALLVIRQRLEQRYPGGEHHFYASPFKELWQEPARPRPPKSGKTVTEPTADPYPGRQTDPYTPTHAHQDLFLPPPTSTASSPPSSPARISSSRARPAPVRPSSPAGSPGA